MHALYNAFKSNDIRRAYVFLVYLLHFFGFVEGFSLQIFKENSYLQEIFDQKLTACSQILTKNTDTSELNFP